MQGSSHARRNAPWVRMTRAHQQSRLTSCALDALCLIARLHHIAADPAALRHQLGKAASQAAGADDLLLAAQHLGLNAKRSRTDADRLHLAALPALALMRDGRIVVLGAVRRPARADPGPSRHRRAGQ